MKATPTQHRKEIPVDHVIDLRFAYPENLNFGDRLKAVRLFTGRKSMEFGAAIGLTEDQVINLVRGKLAPWPSLFRAISLRWSIDEDWLATGKLGTGDPADQASETIKQCFQRTMKEFEPEPIRGIPLSRYGDRKAVLTLEDLKNDAAGKPLLTLKQMEGQMETITGSYSQTPQSRDTSASDRRK